MPSQILEEVQNAITRNQNEIIEATNQTAGIKATCKSKAEPIYNTLDNPKPTDNQKSLRSLAASIRDGDNLGTIQGKIKSLEAETLTSGDRSILSDLKSIIAPREQHEENIAAKMNKILDLQKEAVEAGIAKSGSRGIKF
jgi:hypothetical protein